MGHSLGDALIVAALAAAVVAYLYFRHVERHVERQRRLDFLHQERLSAMDKGIPLPELPLDPPRAPGAWDSRQPLLHGIVWLALGAGGMLTLKLIGPQPDLPALWALPLPLAFLGLGLILYDALVSHRSR